MRHAVESLFQHTVSPGDGYVCSRKPGLGSSRTGGPSRTGVPVNTHCSYEVHRAPHGVSGASGGADGGADGGALKHLYVAQPA